LVLLNTQFNDFPSSWGLSAITDNPRKTLRQRLDKESTISGRRQLIAENQKMD
jgi:hypothetical protein